MRFAAIACCLGFAACSFPHGARLDGDGAVVADDAKRVDAPPPPVCMAGACRHKTIVIDAGNIVGGPHITFPVLVHLATDTDLAAHARPDGFDIAFTTDDGTTKLAYERELFNAATGELVAWVAVPSVSSTADTVLNMYYGNASSTDQQNRAGVWDASFQGVWHLQETSVGAGSLADSTTHSNDATAENAPTLGAAGKIGRAVSLNANATTSRIRMLDSPSLDSTSMAATFELWINWDNTAAGRYQRVLISSNVFASTMRGYELSAQPDGDFYFYPCEGQNAACPATNYNLGPNPCANQTWHHVAATFEWATKRADVYVDGVAMSFNEEFVASTWTTLATPEDWLWGSTPNASGYFRGLVDEIRVSNVVRSRGWIATEHANQASPSTFYTVGPEVATP